MPTLNLEHSLVDDRYEVVNRLSLGSYAEIFTARDRKHDGLLVILKALNTTLQGEIDEDLNRTLVENFENEARAVDKVRHPNIVRQLGHGTAVDLNGTIFHYLIFEYLSGGDLRDRCHHSSLSIEELLFYFNQVCGALAHAHECGVIHRDIKPHNLLLTADRQIVKIADFGVAKITAQDNEEITRVGTDVYAPPEHHPLNSESITGAVLTPSADIYSLAKTAYTLVTGASPKRFSSRAITQLPSQVANQPWATDLLAILNRATDAHISVRYQSVPEFWKDMQTLADSNDLDSTRVRPRSEINSVPPPPPRPEFVRTDAIHQPIVVSVHRRNISGEAIKTAPEGSAARLAGEASAYSGNRVGVSIPINAPAQRNGVPVNRPQTPVVQSQAKPAINRWQRADVFLLRHRKIILTIIALGVLVATLAVVYYSFREASFSILGKTVGNGANATIVRAVNLHEGATQNSQVLGYLNEGAKLRVLKASGDAQDDWTNSWLEVDVIDWNSDKPTATAPHGFVYGSFVMSIDGSR